MNLSDPEPGGLYFAPRNHVGHVLLFLRIVSDEIRRNPFDGSDRREVVVDLVDLDGSKAITRCTVTHNGIAGGLSVGKTIVGRCVQRPASKSGFQGAYALDPVSDGDKSRAQAWLSAREKPEPVKPSGGLAADLSDLTL